MVDLAGLRQGNREAAADAGWQIFASRELIQLWQQTGKQLAGRLNREFFIGRRPVGRLRELQEKDVPFCELLHHLLEENGQVPVGFAPEFQAWLKKLPDCRYAMELDGDLAGCCGIDFHPEAVPKAVPAGDSGPAMEVIVGLTFGLIHPAWQGKGLGTTQVAARLVAARKRGGDVAEVSATVHSVDWLERLGFRFHRIDKSDPRSPGFIGSLLLADDDMHFLAEWLGVKHLIAQGDAPAPVELLLEEGQEFSVAVSGANPVEQ